MIATFEAARDYLVPRLGGGKKWSLGPTRALLAEIGDPQDLFQTVHIAGTNGKGSTATLVAAALRSSGRRVGLYTSPHLVDLRERVLVEDEPITRDAFTSWAARLQPLIDRTDASFFEAYTAIALADFAARGVDVAVVETGLGGRLDSTNVVRPLVSAVTCVGRDHTEYLGDSLEQIAWEKAHVAKSDTPFVIGETDPRLIARLEEVALDRGGRPVVVDANARYDGALQLVGEHQRRNAAVAEAILRNLPAEWAVPDEAVADGFAAARIPGRIDRRGRWIFDVAHNRQAVTALTAALDEMDLRRPLHAIVAVLNDKEYSGIMEDLSRRCEAIWVTAAPSAPAARRMDSPPPPPGGIYERDFDRALDAASRGAGTVLVTGSVYTVGDAMARLPGLSPLG